jgi:hypothetical protein
MGLFGSIVGGITGLASSLIGGDDEQTVTQEKSIPGRTEEQQALWDQFINSILPGQMDTEFDPQWYLEQHPEVREWIQQGEYAKPEIQGWEWDPNINEYRNTRTDETNDLEGIIQEATDQIYRRRNMGEGFVTREQARESAMRGLGLEDMSMAEVRQGAGVERTPYMHYQEIGQGRGYAPSPEAADQTSILDTVGQQADYRRGLAQDYLSDVESLIDRELTGIRAVTDQYHGRLANAPATNISFGGQPMGQVIHRRPLQIAESQYKSGLFPYMRGGELNRNQAAKELSLLAKYTPQAGELAKFDLLRDLVKQLEDRRYGMATTSQTTTADHGFDLMGTLANIYEGSQAGGDLFDSLFGSGGSFGAGTGGERNYYTPFVMAGP